METIKAQEVFNAMYKNDFFSQWMDIKPILIEEGRCILEMEVKKEMLNGYGVLHGGVAFALADSAFAFGSNSYGRHAVSVTGFMSYSKSAVMGDVLMAEAEALHISHKLAEFDVTIKSKSNEMIFYRFRGTAYRSSKEVSEAL